MTKLSAPCVVENTTEQGAERIPMRRDQVEHRGCRLEARKLVPVAPTDEGKQQADQASRGEVNKRNPAPSSGLLDTLGVQDDELWCMPREAAYQHEFIPILTTSPL